MVVDEHVEPAERLLGHFERGPVDLPEVLDDLVEVALGLLPERGDVAVAPGVDVDAEVGEIVARSRTRWSGSAVKVMRIMSIVASVPSLIGPSLSRAPGI